MAQSLRFPGSPTIRVNGHDVEPQSESTAAFGLMCRLYSDGSGAPSQQRLRAAIEKARRCGSVMAGWKTTGASLGAVVTSLLTLGCCLPLPFLGAAGIAGASVFLASATTVALGSFRSSFSEQVSFRSIAGCVAGRVRARLQSCALVWRLSLWFFFFSFLKSLPAYLQIFRADNDEATPKHSDHRRCGRRATGFRLALLRRRKSSGRTAATGITHIKQLRPIADSVQQRFWRRSYRPTALANVTDLSAGVFRSRRSAKAE